MKDDIEQNTNNTEDNATDIKENQAQIHKINQNLSLQSLMIKEVEDSLEKSAQTAEQNSENINILYQRIKTLENKDTKESNKESHDQNWCDILAKLPSNTTTSEMNKTSDNRSP